MQEAGYEVPVVIVRDGLTNQEAGELEKLLISALRDVLVNKMVGGEHSNHSVPRSPEDREKISQRSRGKKLSEGHRSAISAAQTGRVLTEEQREKHRGWKHTEEAKEKIANRSRELWQEGVYILAYTHINIPKKPNKE